ncbi:hypothetical protein MHW47_11145 [Streptomyces sp. OfavH-34-F]|uniref:hypothetical protein n=1 Tax=Streptomyces sp. OfavH-34-F TaxID=2917760 RepID=UPI001EF2D148|nr:hypothetical protein [Streptomyces sp. OfavH-34-F]MCG7524990.1 hypothetical protein [Streptomyces sp. OfavH-34-F]
MINVQVRGESGTVEARAEHGLAWGPELAALNQSEFPMLGHLLPYADTVFNSRQVVTLLAEVPRLPPGIVTDALARELLDLGQTVLDGQHLYLWFLGD